MFSCLLLLQRHFSRVRATLSHLIEQSVGRSEKFYYVGVSGQIISITGITAPAHPHAIDAVVFMALFLEIWDSFSLFVNEYVRKIREIHPDEEIL